MKKVSFPQKRLRAEFPELAKTFEAILEGDNPDVYMYRYIYYPGFKTAERPDRGISLQKIISIVQSHGYHVEIKTKPIK